METDTTVRRSIEELAAASGAYARLLREEFSGIDTRPWHRAPRSLREQYPAAYRWVRGALAFRAALRARGHLRPLGVDVALFSEHVDGVRGTSIALAAPATPQQASHLALAGWSPRSPLCPLEWVRPDPYPGLVVPSADDWRGIATVAL